MAKIVESLKRLSVENGIVAKSTSENNKAASRKCLSKSKGEFSASYEEIVSEDDQNYILGLCGTQRYILLHLCIDYKCI